MEIKLLSPVENSKVSQIPEYHRKFIEAGGAAKSMESIDYYNPEMQTEDHAFGEPVVFRWKMSPLSDSSEVHIVISENENFTKVKEYITKDCELKVYNFLVGKTYFWKVYITEDDTLVSCSDVSCFTTAEETPRWITAGGLSNIRDAGAWRTTEGFRIKQGLIFRGSEMDINFIITEDGKRTLLDDIGIKTDLDLRREAIRDNITKSALGDSVNYVLIPLGPYKEILEFTEEYKEVFKLFCDEKNLPLYYHCIAGCDRTGTVSFLLGAILGMSMEDLILDYELSSLSVWGVRSSESESFKTFLNILNEYGTESDTLKTKCENYLISIGVTREEIEHIRDIMLE